jgi:pimeloyl-ACP methyl ester carboxylesterase
VREEPFELPVDGGAIRGHRAGEGRPALLLHGGAAVSDYLGPCAELLDGLFETIRYTQRGTPPSEAPPPYTIESHMADALAVLDRFGLAKAWAIGHSWGGHLALHLLVAHPERIEGALCIDPLGADPSVFGAFQKRVDEVLTADERTRVHEIEERRRAGDVTEEELVERFRLVWPVYFVRAAFPPPERVGVQASIQTNRSLARDPRAGAVRARRGRPDPACIVDRHGRADPPRAGRDDPGLRTLPVARAARGVSRNGRTPAQSVTSATAPSIRERRGTTSSALTCEHHAMSSSSPGGPYVRALMPSIAFG